MTAWLITCMAAVANWKSIVVVLKIALTVMCCVVTKFTPHISEFPLDCCFYNVVFQFKIYHYIYLFYHLFRLCEQEIKTSL